MDRLGIINKAFIKLGQLPIPDLNDKDKRTVSILAIYESVRDTEQTSYRWTFCTKRMILKPLELKDPITGAIIEVPPLFGYAYQYLLPESFLRLIRIIGSNGSDYEIESGKLLMNRYELLKVIALCKETRESRFPPAFVEAFATKLAIELCETLQQDPSRKSGLMQEYLMHLSTAKKTDAIQRATIDLPDCDWLDVRNSDIPTVG